MSLRSKPTLIGLFVCGAVALAVAAILVFGGGKFFNHQEKFIIYFSDSVNGLSPGSPVRFKGVQIGQVTDILIRYDQPDDNDSIPVLIEIDTTRLHKDLGVDVDLSDKSEFAEQVNSQGLRARLQLLSFVTDQLYIELDYEPADIRRHDIQLSGKYKEIPSVPSNLSEMVKFVTDALQNISEIDFKEMAGKVNHLLDQLNDGVGQVNFHDINASLLDVEHNLNAILTDPNLHEALAKLGVTIDSVGRLSDNLNAQVQPLSNELQATTQQTRETLKEMDSTLSALRDAVSPDSNLRFEVDKTLTEIRDAARSLNVLAEYLENNPSALLLGKPTTTINAPFSLPPINALGPAPAPTGTSPAPAGSTPGAASPDETVPVDDSGFKK
jgi:paraquat-inducible protein B